MSDVEDSNVEDNSGDDESVPSPPPKEMTLEDVTGNWKTIATQQK